MRKVVAARLAFAFVTLLAIYQACGLHALAAPSSKEAPFLNSSYGKQRAELLKLRLLRLESVLSRPSSVGGRGVNNTKAAIRAQTVAVLEEQLILNCATGTLLEWSFPKEDELSSDCTQYVKRLGKLEPDSFVLRCIQEGAESELCEKIFSAQQVVSMNNALSNPALMNDMQSIEGDSFHGTYQKISSEIQQLKFELLSAENEEKKSAIQLKINQALTRATDAACKVQPLILYDSLESIGVTVESFRESDDPEVAELKRLVKDYQSKVKGQGEALKQAPNFEPESTAPFNTSQTLEPTSPPQLPEFQPPPSDIQPKRSSSRRQGRGSGTVPPAPILQPLTVPLATPTADDGWAPKQRSEEERKNLARIRILSDSCFSQIQELLKVDPSSRLAICLRDGQFHPHCIKPPELPRVKPTPTIGKDLAPGKPNPTAMKEKAFSEF